MCIMHESMHEQTNLHQDKKHFTPLKSSNTIAMQEVDNVIT